MDAKFYKLVEFIRSLYPGTNPVQLHAPVFLGNEKNYLLDCIDTTFVSYVGQYVTQFEVMTAEFTGARYAIAVVNGTAALQVALKIAGVKPGDEVITQALTFAATANAIVHAGAEPVFIDVDRDTMGMSPGKLEDWLMKNTRFINEGNQQINQSTGRRISAIVPMHTFGHPCRIDEIKTIAEKYHIPLIEDSAESLGSYYKGRHTGTLGLAGILSYNGNKTVTTGGGGMIITDDEQFAKRARHITTTAKMPHRWEYIHDQAGYNYRMTNVSAAIGVAQMEKVAEYLQNKRETARKYEQFCREHNILFVNEPKDAISNYWLNAIILKNRSERDVFLEFSNNHGIMSRPIWRLMNKLDMYKYCQHDDLTNSQWLEDHIVNIPSSVMV
jgi:perosamine synthetase